MDVASMDKGHLSRSFNPCKSIFIHDRCTLAHSVTECKRCCCPARIPLLPFFPSPFIPFIRSPCLCTVHVFIEYPVFPESPNINPINSSNGSKIRIRFVRDWIPEKNPIARFLRKNLSNINL